MAAPKQHSPTASPTGPGRRRLAVQPQALLLAVEGSVRVAQGAGELGGRP